MAGCQTGVCTVVQGLQHVSPEEQPPRQLRRRPNRPWFPLSPQLDLPSQPGRIASALLLFNGAKRTSESRSLTFADPSWRDGLSRQAPLPVVSFGLNCSFRQRP